MHKIVFWEKFWESLENYIDMYLKYYETIFSDTGIWSQDAIIENYKLDSQKRYTEIVDIIEKKLSNPIISYQDNSTIIRWRSKILLVSFRDEWDSRIITDLEIR